MTQSLTALFSPETSPHPADLQPFRLLCDTLFFYALPDKAGQQGVGTGYTPVHLSAEEEARFQSLAQELRGHEAEFHGGLLASLSVEYGDRDEASAGSLASRLRSGKKASPPQKTEDEILWQAMLILKLAEMFREEELEIARGFLAISGKEAELFAALRGEGAEEEEGDEEEARGLRKVAAARPPGGGPTINRPLLAKAWGRLYLRDPRAAEFPLLVTTREELTSLLADAYEALTGRLPRKLVSLVLPGQTRNGEDDTLVAEFRAATGAYRENFNRLLLEIAASGTISAELLTEIQEAGNDLNRTALLFLKDGRSEKAALHFYAYEGAALRDLFATLTGAPIAERENGPAITGLLAALSHCQKTTWPF